MTEIHLTLSLGKVSKFENAELDKQIATLKNRIKDLEDRKNRIPDNVDGYQQQKIKM